MNPWREKIDSGLRMSIAGVELQVDYVWDIEGNETIEEKVYLASDVRQETNIFELLSDKNQDRIYEAIESDVYIMEGKYGRMGR